MSYTKVVGWGPFRLPGESARRKAIEEAVAAVPRQEPVAPNPPEPQDGPGTEPKHAAAPAEEQDTAAPGQAKLILDSSLNWRIAENPEQLTLPETVASVSAIAREPDLFVGGRDIDPHGINSRGVPLTEDRARIVEHLKNVANGHLMEVAKLTDETPISESQLQTIQSLAYEYEASNSFRLKLLWADKLQNATRDPNGLYSALHESAERLWKTLDDIDRAANLVKPSSRLGRMPDLTFRAVPGTPALANANIRSMQLNLRDQFSRLQHYFATFATGARPELKPAEITDLAMMLERLRLGSMHDRLETIVDLRNFLDRLKMGSWTARNMDAQAETVHDQLRLLEALITGEEARTTPDTPKTDDAETNDPSETRTGGRR